MQNWTGALNENGRKVWEKFCDVANMTMMKGKVVATIKKKLEKLGGVRSQERMIIEPFLMSTIANSVIRFLFHLHEELLAGFVSLSFRVFLGNCEFPPCGLGEACLSIFLVLIAFCSLSQYFKRTRSDQYRQALFSTKADEMAV